MKVTILDDFSLPKIAHSGQCFRVREFSDGTYRFIIGKNILYIKNIVESVELDDETLIDGGSIFN